MARKQADTARSLEDFVEASHLNHLELDALLAARHGDPFAILGPQKIGEGQYRIMVLEPGAEKISVLLDGDDSAHEMISLRPEGLFAAIIATDTRPSYQLAISRNGYDWVGQDVFRFGTAIPEDVFSRFLGGDARALWHVLGAHPAMVDGVSGYRFAVWAPHAWRVALVGLFNNWDGRAHPMRKRHEAGIWEIFMPGLVEGEIYKFEIIGPDGTKLPLKADPVAFWAEHRPYTSSKLAKEPVFSGDHGAWFEKRAAAQLVHEPVSIYQCHLGSWIRGGDEGQEVYSYRAIAAPLIAHLQKTGFTHVQFLPLSEYPLDDSWGYQILGLFASTSRYGSPEDFAFLVAEMHKANIGILCDFVPAHFPIDAHGLDRFDGTALYAPEDPRIGFHPDWNTAIYDYRRPEIRQFLIASALFWLERFGIDGLRVDAVSSMLYLDYSREDGEWLPNMYGGNENLAAIDFLKQLNTAAYGANPGIMMVAEESTAWGGVSRPAHEGGLGFGFKWNMGWMHDSLEYFKRAPIHRAYHHHDVTFSLVYAFSENFILALSHDEVVHGKGSLLTKMGGDNDLEKFASLRLLYALMWFHPGKKLLFMGGEFAQWREWGHGRSLDWHLLDSPLHAGTMAMVADLNRLYKEHVPLHFWDCDPRGFRWIKEQAASESIFVFARYAPEHSPMIALLNMTPVVRAGYRVGVPEAGTWSIIFNGDSAYYGGTGAPLPNDHDSEPVPYDGCDHSILVTTPPMAALLLVKR